MRPTLVRPAARLREARPYDVPRSARPARLRLDGNEGLWPPRALLEAASTPAAEIVRSYPCAAGVQAAIAARFGVASERVLVTAGADDALERALRAVLEPGRELILPVPTFEMIERYALLSGAAVARVPWERGRWPLERVQASITERTACIALVTPNNPTGLEATHADLATIAAAAPHALVLVDQAYAEYGDVDFAPLALERPNVVLVRSLSKALGLAGLRVGYAVGAPQVIGWLRAVGQPYAVSGPSLALAAARLALDGADVRDHVATVRAERAALAEVARELGLEALESRANFVLVRGADAAGVWSRLADRGVAVRAFPGRPGLEDALRITCPGEARAFAELVDALRAAVGRGGAP